jgi:hypothetical protein
MIKRFLSYALTSVWLAGGSAIAAPPSKPPGTISTMTRWIKLFYDREEELITALKNKDIKNIDALVAVDFELRGSGAPANPVPRAEWLAKSQTEASAYSSNIEQMAVHELNETAIVSYLWKSSTPSQPGGSQDVFVVDVWKLTNQAWKLAIRYASPSSVNFNPPGFVVPPEVIDKRY